MKKTDGLALTLGCLGLIAFVTLFAAVGAFVFMVVWNAFVPAAFGGPTIDYWTAFAGWWLLGMIGNAFKSFKD